MHSTCCEYDERATISLKRGPPATSRYRTLKSASLRRFKCTYPVEKVVASMQVLQFPLHQRMASPSCVSCVPTVLAETLFLPASSAHREM